jgi:hypothetical protein
LQTATDGTVVYIKGSQTLTAGAPAATIGSNVYSLASVGSYLIIDGTSTSLITPVIQTSEPYYLVGSQTLIPGGAAITVSGITASLLPGGASIVVGGVTEPVSSVLGPLSGSPGATTTNGGIGGAIASLGGFLPVDPSTSSPVSGYNGTVFTGTGFRCRPSLKSILGITSAIWIYSYS